MQSRSISVNGVARLVRCALLFALLNPNLSVADDVPSKGEGDDAIAADDGGLANGGKPREPDDERRQQVVVVAVWILAGVVLVGLVLVVSVMFLGVHTRRVARAPLPETARDDAFWYLRKELPASTTAAGETSPNETSSEGASPDEKADDETDESTTS